MAATSERNIGMTDAKPSLEDILARWKEDTTYFSNFHAACKLEEDYYLLRRKTPVPPGVDEFRPATAPAIVNIATDHVDVNNLSIDVPATPRSAARAEKLKKLYLGSWLSIKKPVLRTVVRQGFLYGIGFLKPMFDADRWPNAPILDDAKSEEAYKDSLADFLERKKIAFPLTCNVVNPRNMVWDDSKTRMKWAIEFYDMPANQVANQYPEWQAKAGQTMAHWMEYWDENWVAYLADEKLVWGPYKHGYGFLPHNPLLPVQSFILEDGPPEERYRGILKPVHTLLDEEARLTSQISAIVRTTAWRSLDFTGPRQMAEEAAEKYELWGGKNVLPPGVTVTMSPMPQVPPDLYQQLSVVQTMIEEATFPNVIRGMRPKGVSTGFGISVQAGMGRLVFSGVADGLRHAIEETNKRFAMLVENKIMGPITVHARTEVHNFDESIGPEDIRGYYENSVEVKAEAPEEREREAILAMRLREPGPDGMPMISLYEAQRRAGIANPLEEQMRTKMEMLVNSPEVRAIQAQALLQQLGIPLPVPEDPEGAPGGVGSMNLGGAQLPRPGEASIQKQRVNTNNQAGVFPKGFGGMDLLGQLLGSPNGGSVRTPGGRVG